MTGPIARMLAGPDFDERALASARCGVAERLTDPYLTDHDRWVLRQFARFLGGHTPEPDSRASQPGPDRPLRRQPRVARL